MLHKFLDPAVIKYRARQAKTKRFEPKLKFTIESDKYIIKTADSDDEFNEVLRLRYEVFLKEGLKRKTPIRVDVDRFDFLADHLLIIDKQSQKIVGTYRLISSLFSPDFYSETEFVMHGLMDLPGNKLELGRACTAQGFRSGIAIALLWKGIGRYLSETKSQFLFGCGSVKTVDPVTIARLTKYLKIKNYLNIMPEVHPTTKFEVKDLHAHMRKEIIVDEDPISDLLPSLLQSYFKAGAKVVAMPALDRAFKCIDYLTVLDTTQITAAYEKRYNLC